ncbi:MAG: hypothetical protein FJX56_11640 [Alphaproteobacteria bacterium]|nr:hypothetical protein [Alphaproteobacteria bacterium]
MPRRGGWAAVAFALAAGTAAPAWAGFAEGVRAYEDGDYEGAYREWLPLAEAGDPAAERNLGLLYRKGLGVPQDFVAAAIWYHRAAERGLARAQANLAVFYLRGQGVAQDLVEATRWFELAARQGHVISQYNLGLIYEAGLGPPADPVRALGWYYLAAKAGHPRAIERLAVLVVQGYTAAPIEEVMFTEPAARGDLAPEERDAQTTVGAPTPTSQVDWEAVPNTLDRPAPRARADDIAWEEPAAESPARPTPAPADATDPEARARALAEIAPATGEPASPGPPSPEPEPAMMELAAVDSAREIASAEAVQAPAADDPLATGLESYRAGDYARALALWLPLAEQGSRWAQFYVGALYRDGHGVAADPLRARLWWSLAAARGHELAAMLLAEPTGLAAATKPMESDSAR